MSYQKVKVGIVGCGNISPAYFRGCGFFSEILEVVACSDIDMSRAESRAQEFNIPKACDVQTLLNDPEIEIVVNLTVPKAHGEVALAALEAGKSVYNEKPLALSREEGKKMLQLAKEKGLRVGCAPDTFLGAGIQTCRRLIDEGEIGEPVAAFAAMICHGHESWHPSPEFYYEVGGGPMFDMGPYYLTALAVLMGPVKRVTGSARITFPERTITSQPKYGKKIKVEVPTHIVGVMDFASGAVGNIITSFDVWAGELPRIEIYGTEGTLSVPDPNGFGGPVRMWRGGEWREVPLKYEYVQPGRGIGVADMAYAMRLGREHRANGDLAYHVLDLMHAFHDPSDQNRHVNVESTCRRPDALPLGPVKEALAQ